MEQCCGISPEMENQKEQDEALLNTEFTLNGVKLRLRDMFPDAWAARDFNTKLNLLNKSKGGKALLDTSPESIMDDD